MKLVRHYRSVVVRSKDSSGVDIEKLSGIDGTITLL